MLSKDKKILFFSERPFFGIFMLHVRDGSGHTPIIIIRAREEGEAPPRSVFLCGVSQHGGPNAYIQVRHRSATP